MALIKPKHVAVIFC